MKELLTNQLNKDWITPRITLGITPISNELIKSGVYYGLVCVNKMKIKK